MRLSQPLSHTNWNLFSSASLEDVKAVLKNRTIEEKKNDVDGHGISPIHGAAEKTNSPEIISALLDNGYYVNSRTKTGLSPLHYAATFNKYELVMKQLLKNGAFLDVKDKDNTNPLHAFCMFGENEIVGLYMIDHIDVENIDFVINVKDNMGKLPIDYIDQTHKFYLSSFYWRLRDLTIIERISESNKQKIPYLINSYDICKVNTLSNAHRGFKANFKKILYKYKFNVVTLANQLNVDKNLLYEIKNNVIKVAPEIMFLYLFHHSNGKYFNDCRLWYDSLNYEGKLTQQELLEIIS